MREDTGMKKEQVKILKLLIAAIILIYLGRIVYWEIFSVCC